MFRFFSLKKEVARPRFPTRPVRPILQRKTERKVDKKERHAKFSNLLYSLMVM